jgi:DNA-directed RNA polymerase specialized sigma24 family protein
LFTIVRRECLRLLERRQASIAPDAAEDALLAEVVDPADALALRRRVALLAATLADLDRSRSAPPGILLLRDIQERSAPEAAAELGISVDALKSRLHRARVNLRDHMRARAAEL